jgi:hypothetical protein
MAFFRPCFQHVIESIQGAGFQKMCADVATPLSLGTTSFGTVTDFLQGAGQSQIVSQVYSIFDDNWSGVPLHCGL